MKILDSVPAQQSAAIQQVAGLVQAACGRALLVRGCVRDGLLGLPAKDIDIEVYGLSASTLEAILAASFRVDTVGRAFGVFILKGLEIDIALPRRESRIGPKHTDFKVEGDPSMQPEEAAARRDFTINAISYDPLSGELLDPYKGRDDLQNRLLRHVSPAFVEDPLRVLRGMQFVARFELTADASTIELCKTLDPTHLPAERLWEEWKKLILKGQRISLGLEFLRACNWLHAFPELEALVGCQQDPQWHTEGDVWTHTGHCMDAFAEQRRNEPWEDLIVGLAVLCHDFGKPVASYTDESGRIRSPRHDVEGVPIARAFLQRLTRQKAVCEEVLPLVEQHMRPLALYRDQAGDAAIRRLAARVQRVDRLIRVAHADKCGRPPIQITDFPEGDWLLGKAEALAIEANAPKPLMLGRHLIDLGVTPGPQFGSYLDRAYQAQLDGAFNDVDGGIKFLKSQLSP